MFTINKDKFFTILSDLNKSCIYEQIKDTYFMDIPKFKNLMEYIDLNKYSLEYVQNRLISIRHKDVPIELIRNLIICPIDTRYNLDKNEECENISFNFPTKERKSYLTKDENPEEKETYCIKGFMNPSILNTILIYMLNTELIPMNTMVIFTLKGNKSKFDGDDIIEYLQKYINVFNRSLTNVINLNYTSLSKGYPRKDYTGKITIEGTEPSFTNIALKKFLYIENFDYKNKNNFDVEIKPLPKILDNYRKILSYFRTPVYIEDRLFIFSDKPIKNKYFVTANSKFVVEWNTIDKYINQLYYFLKGGEY